jgi:hypothetical protein
MQDEEIQRLVDSFHAKDDKTRAAAWAQLRNYREQVLPYLAELFPKARWFEVRRDIAYHCIGYAQVSDVAIDVGRMAVADKSSVVRYRGCCVLAYSLRPEVLPILDGLLNHPDAKTVEDAKAAIDAIRSRNHHYFVDRRHMGRMFWGVDDDGGEPIKLLPKQNEDGGIISKIRKWFGRAAGQ